MQVDAIFKEPKELGAFLAKLGSAKLQAAGAMGFNDHADEQRRMSVNSISQYTGVPKSRMASKTKVIKAAPGPMMIAKIQTRDTAIPLGTYGAPVWRRSMRGAEATGWNVRRIFPGSFVAKGQVLIRTTNKRFPVRSLSMAVLPNELAKPSRPNVARAERFAAMDLQKRVVRHVIRALGT